MRECDRIAGEQGGDSRLRPPPFDHLVVPLAAVGVIGAQDQVAVTETLWEGPPFLVATAALSLDEDRIHFGVRTADSRRPVGHEHDTFAWVGLAQAAAQGSAAL